MPARQTFFHLNDKTNIQTIHTYIHKQNLCIYHRGTDKPLSILRPRAKIWIRTNTYIKLRKIDSHIHLYNMYVCTHVLHLVRYHKILLLFSFFFLISVEILFSVLARLPPFKEFLKLFFFQIFPLLISWTNFSKKAVIGNSKGLGLIQRNLKE